MGYGIVYLATNRVTGKSYVGQTMFSLEDRKAGHEHQSKMGGGWIFHKSIRKHGPESFSWKVLCEADNKFELDNAESIFINAFNALSPNGYNLREGGSHGKLHLSTCAKISKLQTGKKHSAEWSANISKGLTGKPGHPMSEQTKANIRAANARRKAEGRYTVSDDQKAKIAATLRARGGRD